MSGIHRDPISILGSDRQSNLRSSADTKIHKALIQREGATEGVFWHVEVLAAVLLITFRIGPPRDTLGNTQTTAPYPFRSSDTQIICQLGSARTCKDSADHHLIITHMLLCCWSMLELACCSQTQMTGGEFWWMRYDELFWGQFQGSSWCSMDGTLRYLQHPSGVEQRLVHASMD